MRKKIVLLLIITGSIHSFGQQPAYTSNDSLTIRNIFDEALLKGESYLNLNVLCKSIGHRLTGSPQADQAVNWAQQEVSDYQVSKVYKQEVTAVRWVRGDIESVSVQQISPSPQKSHAKSKLEKHKLYATALGGSVGTNGPLTAPVVEVGSIAELAKFTENELRGKIVFLNGPMDKTQISTFDAYGACVSQRYAGASESASYGAIGVLVRSMTTLTDEHAHAGSMSYKKGVTQIPAAAISTSDADMLHEYLQLYGTMEATLNFNCYTAADSVKTSNLVAEIKGTENPEQIIVFGAHIDSWDLGEGAHDDGAGVVQCMEVLRLFNALNIKPKNTIRMVLYMNEENGNMGGKTYAANAKLAGENHICALESDRGGFSPRGFSIDGKEAQLAVIQQWQSLLDPYGLHYFKPGYGGVDIGPLKNEENRVNEDIMLLGLYPDPQRYFDYHHSIDDVFENVNQRELELGGASMAAMIYLIDTYWSKFKTN